MTHLSIEWNDDSIVINKAKVLIESVLIWTEVPLNIILWSLIQGEATLIWVIC